MHELDAARPLEDGLGRLKSPVLQGLILGVMATVGLLLAASGVWFCLKEHEATNWPTTPGVITGAEVHVSCGGRGGCTKTPDITYAYEVGGTRLYSTRVVIFWAWIIRVTPDADDVVGRYPEGTSVTVHYNPRDHEEAVLEPGRYGIGLGTLGVGLFLLLSTLGAFRGAKEWITPAPGS